MWNFSNKQNNTIRIDTLHDKTKDKHIHPTNNMFWLLSKCQIITLEIKFSKYSNKTLITNSM